MISLRIADSRAEEVGKVFQKLNKHKAGREGMEKGRAVLEKSSARHAKCSKGIVHLNCWGDRKVWYQQMGGSGWDVALDHPTILTG